MKYALRTLIVSLTATVVVCGMAGNVGAAPPRIVTTEVDFSFPDSYLTDLCGIEVEFFNVGTLNSKLFVDQSGTIVREVDTTQGDRFGWFSPETGRTVEFPNAAMLVTDYPNGTAVGSPATTTGSGLSGKVPGVPADAGSAVFAGHVAFLDPDGVPIVAFDQLVSIKGHTNAPEAFEAALCAALSG
jgi:hypothetical protein